MKKFLAALLAVLISASAAAAYPPPPPPHGRGPAGPPPRRPMGPPPPPPHHRHPHDYCRDGDLFSGLAVGLLIGALANAGHDDSAAQARAKAEEERLAYERDAAEVRDAARSLAETQSENVMQIVSKLGPDHALEDLDNYWQAHGQPTLQDVNRPPRKLKVAGFSRNMALVYDIDRERSTVTVTVSAPDYDVSETRSLPYVYTPPVPAAPVRSVERTLGFTVSDDSRSPDGRLVITSVTPGTAAAYAGVASGAVLYAVDGNDTAQAGAEQLEAYVNGRAAAGATVKITFSDGAGRKTVEIRP